MRERAGFDRSNLSGEAAYKSFVPSPLPPKPALVLNSEAIEVLVEAHKQLQRLESLSTHIPNLNLFISMYVRKEALMSSQIEGTQASLDDILDPMIEENVDQNVADVVNYIHAFEYALERMKALPLCNRLLRETHAVLMSGVRGQEWTPGEFRRSQNWIGGVGSTLANARFIPPNPEDMVNAISDLEKYFHAESEIDVLIQAALIHYQFETIHPFLDGNGRIGRMLIVLFLMDKKLLSSPALYISYFLKRYRSEYYDRLGRVRSEGDYEQWVLFFLHAVIDSAEDATRAIMNLIALRERNTELIASFGRSSKTVARVLNHLEQYPIVTIQKTANTLHLSFNTVSDAIDRLMGIKVVNQVNQNRRNRSFAYTAYLDILREGTEAIR